jgi:hypothetical protein
MQYDLVPDKRTAPLLELGDTFLGPGNIAEGFTLPTGAVWQPNLIVWGNYRTAINHVDNEFFTGDEELTEWVNRLDLFAQLSMSQTDRIVIGVRTFDEDSGFFGYQFDPDEGWVDPELDISVAFIEVNLAELFPGRKATPPGENQRRYLDIDLSAGRQTLQFQGGMLVNDNLDSLAITRNNISLIPGATNTRAAFIYAWDDIDRRNNLEGINREDDDATLYGIFTETDMAWSTIAVDLTQVDSDDEGDGFFAGISATQRIRKINTTFRLVHSDPTDGTTETVTRGTVFTVEGSWQPPYGHDNVYLNAFWAEDEFSSAARDFSVGAPLGLIGILYASVGLGGYAAPLGSDTRDSYGGALGYQKFSADNRRQVIVELGARRDHDDSDRDQAALGVRFQQALGRRYIARVDGYVAKRDDFDTGWGLRTEFQVKF